MKNFILIFVVMLLAMSCKENTVTETSPQDVAQLELSKIKEVVFTLAEMKDVSPQQYKSFNDQIKEINDEFALISQRDKRDEATMKVVEEILAFKNKKKMALYKTNSNDDLLRTSLDDLLCIGLPCSYDDNYFVCGESTGEYCDAPKNMYWVHNVPLNGYCWAIVMSEDGSDLASKIDDLIDVYPTSAFAWDNSPGY